MKKILIISVLSILLIFPFTLSAQQQSITGTWMGSLDVGMIKLRLVLQIRDTAGTLVTTLDSPDQGAYGIGTDATFWNPPALNITAEKMAAAYTAVLQPGDTLLKGTWSQGGQNFDLDMVKQITEFKLKRPQEPKPPFPYSSGEVTFPNAKAGITLAGTLLIPEGTGPFPAVVLVSGSGPQDRNEELMGHKPFLVIADHLARRGIAVLRYDDRGIGSSEGTFGKATSFDFAGDAAAAVDFLLTRKEINPEKVGIAGHSEGGLIAPIVAAEKQGLGFIILMAGPGTDGKTILEDQSRLLLEKSGESAMAVKESVKLNNQLYDILMAEPDSALARQKLNDAIVRGVNKAKSIKPADKPAAIRQAQQGISQIITPWFRTFLSYNPRPTLEKVKCPVLAINGTNDLQVPCRKNLEAIASALEKGGNNRYKTVTMEGLNHLFQHSKTGLPSEYGSIEETFAPEALEVMAEWILGL